MEPPNSSLPGRITLPRLPEKPIPHPFPLIASTAPVVVSLAIWLATGSPFALVFAFLGPAIALASLADARFQARRTARRERRRFADDLASTAAAVERFHQHERTALDRENPPAARILMTSQSDPERWRVDPGSPIRVRLGRGPVDSSLQLLDETGGRASPDHDPCDGHPQAQLAALATAAAVVRDAPIVVDAGLGIGICGPATSATAMARALIVQLAHTLSPNDTHVLMPPAGWHWVTVLPHYRPEASVQDAVSQAGASQSSMSTPPPALLPRVESQTAMSIVFRCSGERGSSEADRRIVVAVAGSEAALPRECRVVIRLNDGRSAQVLRHPHSNFLGSLVPEFISEAQAAVFARMLTACASAEGIGAARMLPPAVPLRELLSQPGPDGGPGSLGCAVGVAVSGVFRLDLVRDGPHAVIGGMTGSGKSELLITWLLAMAFHYGAERVTFLLVDFKGGSSFHALQRLPHNVGLVTDLDARSAARALSSLRAELRHREKVLVDAGARSIDELAGAATLPRLVIAVDEFAAMVDGFPELHALFADIAARGRSLGMHLILCTQRPAGVVRETVLANCSLRISLRVNNDQDSIAVIGSTAAAALTSAPVGRCLVSSAGREPELVQVALADIGDADRVVGHQDGRPRVPIRRPWCDPLPLQLRLTDLPEAAGGIAFGLMDLPEEQRQCSAVYAPSRDGNLLAIGGHGSGKTTLLCTLASAVDSPAAQFVPADPEGAWDAVADALEHPSAGLSPRLLLFDDLDALVPRFGEDHRQPFVDRVCELLRSSSSSSRVQVVATVKGVLGHLHTLAVLFDSRLIMRLPGRQEHVMAGGDIADYSGDLPPGGAHWQGHRIQLASPSIPTPTPTRLPVETVVFEAGAGYAVVSPRPQELIRRLTADRNGAARGDGAAAIDLTIVELGATGGWGGSLEVPVIATDAATVVIAPVDSWQAHWGLLAALRSTMPVLFDRCTVRDVNALTRPRSVPPPIAASSDDLWLLDPAGAVRRVRLP